MTKNDITQQMWEDQYARVEHEINLLRENIDAHTLMRMIMYAQYRVIKYRYDSGERSENLYNVLIDLP